MQFIRYFLLKKHRNFPENQIHAFPLFYSIPKRLRPIRLSQHIAYNAGDNLRPLICAKQRFKEILEKKIESLFISPTMHGYQKTIVHVKSASWNQKRYNKTQFINWASLYQLGVDELDLTH